MSSNGKVLILGGTGAIGSKLATRFVDEGYDVFITSRVKHAMCEGRCLVGNAMDDSFLKDTLSAIKPDIVVDFMHYSTDRFRERINLLMSGSWRYVFLSSYRVFADAEVIREDSKRLLDTSADKEFLATDDYALAKARCEDIIKASGYCNWTIVRPSITYSSERFQYGCLEANTVCFRSFQNVPVVMPEEMLEKATTMTWAGDTAEMIYRLSRYENAKRQDYNLATSETQTWRDVARIYGEAINLTTRPCSLAFYETIVDKYQMHYDRMFNRRVDNTKVKTATGMNDADFMPLAKGLAMELERFRAAPRYKWLAMRQNALMDRFLGTRISLKGVPFSERKIYYANRYPLLSKFTPRNIIRNIFRMK